MACTQPELSALQVECKDCGSALHFADRRVGEDRKAARNALVIGEAGATAGRREAVEDPKVVNMDPNWDLGALVEEDLTGVGNLYFAYVQVEAAWVLHGESYSKAEDLETTEEEVQDNLMRADYTEAPAAAIQDSEDTVNSGWEDIVILRIPNYQFQVRHLK
jgi:hypothetical protein